MTTNQLPVSLRRSRTIGIYSPSGSFRGAPDKEALFQAGIDRLKTLGFEVRLSPHCQAKWYHMAGTPEQRISDLESLLRDPDVDIIVPSIGGHVAATLLPSFDPRKIAASGKAFFGFSDNSILPLIASASTGVITFHTLCDVTFGFGRFAEGKLPVTERSFLRAVREGQFDLVGTGNWKGINEGDAEGILLGGNLKGVCFLLGTPWCPDWRGKILFWESADPLHAVIQQLTQLGNAGVLSQISGMIIGRASTLKESFYPRDEVIPIDQLLLDIFGLRGRYPIIIEADIGHDVENVTIPLGSHLAMSSKAGKATCRTSI